jgi:hypothetical protein
MDALLDRQFLGVKPEGLNGMAKFAYISQTHSIDTQVKGYEDKTKTKLIDTRNSDTPTDGGRQGGTAPPSVQVQVQEKEEEKVQEKEKRGVVYPFDSSLFFSQWEEFKEYKKDEHNFSYKSEKSEQAALKKLGRLSNQTEETAIKILHETIANGWKGFFKLEKDGATKEGHGRNGTQSQSERTIEKYRRKGLITD